MNITLENIQMILRELIDGTPGVTLGMLLDEEGLPLYLYPTSEVSANQIDKAAISALNLLSTAEKTSIQLDLHGLKGVLVRTENGYVYGIRVKGSTFVAKTDLNISLGALFMAVQETYNRLTMTMANINPSANFNEKVVFGKALR
jgi:predicted regulator of Ras-like GTPase activity (Roadblock/LC7/MglB family)